ncbi:4'-phosphopantetheinyl transferase family protein [Candidatus Poriferisocius sp.]|uniref:4'-phosphopantetheinyl transferase family protein n=1 Tax=Candidatus Poriferisocius sp. TaxID=3101276 RepID=UPI003B01DE9B
MINDKDQWWQPFKSIGDIDVFHVDLTPHVGYEAEALAWLDGEERSRWERFQSLAARRRFVLCRAALRSVLCRKSGCTNESLEFIASNFGKPYARVGGKPVAMSFNVSHSGKHGLIAVAPRGELGVDVEERSQHRNLEVLIEGVLSPQEIAELRARDDRQRQCLFFRFWTIKEALVKAHGKGVSLDVARLEIPEDMRHGAIRSKGQFTQLSNTTWHLEDIGSDDFAAAIVYEAGPAS